MTSKQIIGLEAVEDILVELLRECVDRKVEGVTVSEMGPRVGDYEFEVETSEESVEVDSEWYTKEKFDMEWQFRFSNSIIHPNRGRLSLYLVGGEIEGA